MRIIIKLSLRFHEKYGHTTFNPAMTEEILRTESCVYIFLGSKVCWQLADIKIFLMTNALQDSHGMGQLLSCRWVPALLVSWVPMTEKFGGGSVINRAWEKKSGWTYMFSDQKWLLKCVICLKLFCNMLNTNLPGYQPFGWLTTSWLALSHLAGFKDSFK